MPKYDGYDDTFYPVDSATQSRLDQRVSSGDNSASIASTQWQPLTLQGGGLVHVAFGAIIGVTAFGRTKEKLAGAA